MNVTLDLNKLFTDGVAAIHGGVAVWVIFLFIGLLMSPLLIPAISKAIAEQRAITHKREQNLMKIRNSVADRQRKTPARVGTDKPGVGKLPSK